MDNTRGRKLGDSGDQWLQLAGLEAESDHHPCPDGFLEELVLQEPRVARLARFIERGAHIRPSRIVVGLIDTELDPLRFPG